MWDHSSAGCLTEKTVFPGVVAHACSQGTLEAKADLLGLDI